MNITVGPHSAHPNPVRLTMSHHEYEDLLCLVAQIVEGDTYINKSSAAFARATRINRALRDATGATQEVVAP